MVITAALAAIVIALQMIANYIQLGTVSITLALIPVVIGAIICGPSAGFILGLVEGVTVMLAPSTLLFFNTNAIGTVVVCLSKTSIAGLLAGFIYKWLSKKSFVAAIILAAITVPIINTGLFVAFCPLFFYSIVADGASAAGQSVALFLIVGFVGINFIIEFLINSVLSPTIVYIIRIYENKHPKEA